MKKELIVDVMKIVKKRTLTKLAVLKEKYVPEYPGEQYLNPVLPRQMRPSLNCPGGICMDLRG